MKILDERVYIVPENSVSFPYWNPISFYEHMGYHTGQIVQRAKELRADRTPLEFYPHLSSSKGSERSDR